MPEDILLLTRADASNYHALCAAIENKPMRRSSNRRDSDRISAARRLAMMVKQNYACAECGVAFGPEIKATFEHVVPYRFGGEANRHNGVLVCLPCNLKRDADFSIGLIERHFGPIDYSKVEYIPHVRFHESRSIR
jgi:hypothetical protein